jgi:hypothetical protein
MPAPAATAIVHLPDGEGQPVRVEVRFPSIPAAGQRVTFGSLTWEVEEVVWELLPRHANGDLVAAARVELRLVGGPATGVRPA